MHGIGPVYYSLIVIGLSLALAGCRSDGHDHSVSAPAETCKHFRQQQISAVHALEAGFVEKAHSECHLRLERETGGGVDRLELMVQHLPSRSVRDKSPGQWGVHISAVMGWPNPPIYGGRIDGNFFYLAESERSKMRVLVLNEVQGQIEYIDSTPFIVVELTGSEDLMAERDDFLESMLWQLAISLSRP